MPQLALLAQRSQQQQDGVLEQRMIISKNFKCPCCDYQTLTETGSYEICDVCGWEDDPVQSSDPTFVGGANQLSLDQARVAWQTKLKKQ